MDHCVHPVLNGLEGYVIGEFDINRSVITDLYEQPAVNRLEVI